MAEDNIIGYRVNRLIQLTASERCKIYIILSTLGSFVAWGVQFVKLPFFSDKHNILNQIFVKWCWLWTIIAVTFLACSIFIVKRPPTKYLFAVALRLVLGTLYWYAMVTLINGLKHGMGRCSDMEIYFWNACVDAGHSWDHLMDISGHTFMLVFCNLLIK